MRNMGRYGCDNSLTMEDYSFTAIKNVLKRHFTWVFKPPKY